MRRLYWRLRRALAAFCREFGERSLTYGHDGTIHKTEYLDVEVDADGVVVAVWFRCMALPFVQRRGRVDMRGQTLPPLVAVVVRA